MTIVVEKSTADAQSELVTTALQAEALSRARRGALWIVGGGALTAGSYFTSTQTYWITWGPMAYGAYAALRGITDYLRLSGRFGPGLASVIALALLGGAAAGAVAVSEWASARILAAEERAVAIWGEATDLTDGVFDRTGGWTSADARDMTAAAALLDSAALTVEVVLPPIDFPKGVAALRHIAQELRDRAALARRLAKSTSEAERQQLFADWDQQSQRLRVLGQSMSSSGATAASSAEPSARAVTRTQAPPTAITPTPFRFVLAAPPTPAPTPRPVGLRADQVILPAARFPYPGYDVSRDEASGVRGWSRTFRSDAGSYYFVSVVVEVLVPGQSGTSVVAAADCASFRDSTGKAATSSEFRAEVLGDAAKACRHEVRPGAVIYEYVTADRNVVIFVQANPRYFENTGTVALGDLVDVARLQLQIISSLAPR